MVWGVRRLVEAGFKPTLSVRVTYEYEHRIYTTKKPIEDDPWHADRKDRKHTFSGKLGLKIAPSLVLNILDNTYVERDTNSPKKAKITEVKDYANHVVSAGLVFIVK